MNVLDSWAPPVPLTDFSSLPSFPVNALPATWLRAHIEAHSLALQTPVDLMAMVDFTSVSAALARKVKVQVNEGWLEPVNLWTVTALPSGERKSPAYMQSIRVFHLVQKALAVSMGDAIIKDQAQRRLWDKERDYHERKAVEYLETDPEKYKQHADKARELTALLDQPEVTPLQLVADDTTTEALGQILHRNGERIAVFSDEGGIFQIMGGLYNNKVPNLDLWLKSYSGTPSPSNRVGRGYINLTHPLVTMGLVVQPQVIEALAERGEFTGRGLLARPLWSLPQTAVGYRDIKAPPAPETVSIAYEMRLQQLIEWFPKEPVILTLSAGADALFSDFRQSVEDRMKPGQVFKESDLIEAWGEKLPGQMLRVVNVLHTAEGLGGTVISEATMSRAIALADYFTAHARAAFQALGADPRLGKARRLLGYFARTETLSCSQAALFQSLKHTGGFKSPDDLGPVLAFLEAHGWVRQKPQTWAGIGQRPKPIWEVHPSAMKGKPS